MEWLAHGAAGRHSRWIPLVGGSGARAAACLGRPYYYSTTTETRTLQAWHESCGLIHGMFVSASCPSLRLRLRRVASCRVFSDSTFVRTYFVCCIPAKRHMQHVYLITTLCIPVKRHMQHASRRYVRARNALLSSQLLGLCLDRQRHACGA